MKTQVVVSVRVPPPPFSGRRHIDSEAIAVQTSILGLLGHDVVDVGLEAVITISM